MKLIMKPPLLLLAFLVLAACSSLPGSKLVSEKQSEKPVTIADNPPFKNQELPSDQSTNIAYSEASIPASTITLVKEIQDLTAQRQSSLVPDAAGWLHLIVRQIHSKADPLSSAGSDEQIQLEQWLSLDDQGRVRADIRRILDNQGQGGEFNLLAGGSWVNMPLAGFTSDSTTLPFDPSYGILSLVNDLIQQGQSLNKSTLYKDCWYQGDKYTLSDGQITHEIVVKPSEGTLRWIKTWQVSSGAITLIDSYEIALEERLPQPPGDVLALVSQNVQ